jgi:hypothetical protein
MAVVVSVVRCALCDTLTTSYVQSENGLAARDPIRVDLRTERSHIGIKGHRYTQVWGHERIVCCFTKPINWAITSVSACVWARGQIFLPVPGLDGSTPNRQYLSLPASMI